MYRFEIGRLGLLSLAAAAVLLAALLVASGLALGASFAADSRSTRSARAEAVADGPADRSRSVADRHPSGTARTDRDRAASPTRPRRQDVRSPRVSLRTVPQRTLANRLAYVPGSRRPAFDLAPGRPAAAGPLAPLLAFSSGHPVPQTPFGRLIYDESRRRQLNPHLVAAVISVESGFDPSAVSSKGAIGLMQVIPETAERFGVDPGLLHDPLTNLTAGTQYLRWLSEHYEGSVGLTLAAYNAGDGAVDRWGGIPPYDETRRYVRKVFSTLTTLGARVPG